MAHQPSQIRLSIASPLEIERTARDLMALREGYLTTGMLTRYAPRPLIMQSWQRCQVMQVNPGMRQATLAITHETQLQDILEANELFIRAAMPVLSYLVDFFADSGYAVVLSDAHGCLLQVVGDAEIIRRLTRIDFIPGGRWSEEAAGTNAIGTTLADGHVVQLMAAEHFCDGWQDLTCTATSVRHPETGAIIGALNVTGNYRLIRPFLTSFLVASALEIQQELRTLLSGTTPKQHRSTHSIPTLIPALPHSLHSISFEHSPGSLHSDEQHFTDTGALLHSVRLQLNQQKIRTNDAERLARAAAAISASLDSQIALEVIAEQMAYLLGLDGAAVGLFNEVNDVDLHSWSKQTSWLEPLHRLTILFQEAKELISLIHERGEPVIVDDVLSYTLLPASFTQQSGIRSLALFPLVTARGTIGFLIAPKSDPYHWLIDDIRLGLTFAAQAATAIENAWLFSSLQLHVQRIELLNTIAQCLSTQPDPNQSLDLVLECITAEMNLDAGMIFQSDAISGNLTLVAHKGLAAPEASEQGKDLLHLLYNTARSIVTSGEPLLVTTEEDGESTTGSGVQSTGVHELMAVPLVAGTTAIGILLVANYRPGRLTREALTLFITIGQQLGLTLKNAQLLRSMSEVEALREADKLKSGFLAAVSHDLRSPLTAIRTSVESLLDSSTSQAPEEQEHLLHNIAGQASRLGLLVDQLLDLSRIEAGALPLDRDWTDLRSLINDTVTKFQQLNQHASIARGFSADLPLHYVDPTRLAQVIWNLLENAHKYAPTHAVITVKATLHHNEVLITVSDRGPGIPVGEQENIFQRFYRLPGADRTQTQGSGLGLAICKGIIEAHHGRIWVENRPEGGCTFCIALPLPHGMHSECETQDGRDVLCTHKKEIPL